MNIGATSTWPLNVRILGLIKLQLKPYFAILGIPLLTGASACALTAKELLDGPMLQATPELSDDKLLETPIFGINIGKLPAMVTTSAPTEPPAAANLTISSTSINDFLKLTLDDISSLALIPIEESMPIQPIDMETEAYTATSYPHVD
uniref:Uncharacterized protein n=1 Tax=Romanomermis culicivorax TaxID=13658 RepID=A0A915HI74_ROMCU